ncbi:MAG TPA: ABC transporter substrate-binding protein, partial [Mycobacterium sp.]
MRRLHRRHRSLPIVFVAMLILSACGGGGGGANKTATDSSIAKFTYGMQTMPVTLDVANNYDSKAMALMRLVTQPLEIANLDGTYTPVLAKKVSQPDDLTLVYDLRDDVVFSDGTPMTSADVVWTIEHLRGDTTQTASELTNFDSVRATGEHQVTIT